MEPSLTNIEVIKKNFGHQLHNNVISFGGGVKVKDLRVPLAKEAELEAKLHETQQENISVIAQISALEDEFLRIKEMLLAQQSNEQSQATSPESEFPLN